MQMFRGCSKIYENMTEQIMFIVNFQWLC
jgi:hypothetical protein